VGDHPSGTHVAVRLLRPEPGSLGRATLKHSPIWPCTGRGLPSRPVTRTAGELLPHRFTLTRTPRKGPLAVCSLLRFPSGFPGWPLASALLYGVRTFLGWGPCGLRRAPRRAPLAATWLARSVYHRVREPRHDRRLRRRTGRHDDDQRRMRTSTATTATAPPTQAAAHAYGCRRSREPSFAAPKREAERSGCDRPPPTQADCASRDSVPASFGSRCLGADPMVTTFHRRRSWCESTHSGNGSDGRRPVPRTRAAIRWTPCMTPRGHGRETRGSR